jgi:aldose 1-epimerase
MDDRGQPVPPSGRQLELAYGATRVTITEVGGGLRRFEVGGFDLLDGYELAEMASRGRGQLLLPWPNRIRGGRYTFAGVSYQLAVNEVALGNASHGLTRWSAWELTARSPSAARATHVLRAQSGYPFTIAFAVDYHLDAAGLTVTMTATNRSATPAPVGMGAHPYFRLPGADGAHGADGPAARADELSVRVPARRRLVSDASHVPISEVPVDSSEGVGRAEAEGGDAGAGGAEAAGAAGRYDFRVARPVGPTVLDTCYTDLERDPDGRARVCLRAPGGAGVTVWLDETWPYVQVFTGDTLSEAERRRSVAVEPLTCPADAFNSGAGLRVLAPGESFGGSWGITPEFPGRRG